MSETRMFHEIAKANVDHERGSFVEYNDLILKVLSVRFTLHEGGQVDAEYMLKWNGKNLAWVNGREIKRSVKVEGL